MTNVKTEVSKGILTITVDLTQDHGPSASGKTTVVATTHGGREVEPGITLNLNVNKRNQNKRR
jgi:hypothetical protein